MDYFIFKGGDEICLMRVLFTCLKHVEPRCLLMEEEALFLYIKSGKFLVDCFDEFTLEQMFLI